MIIEGLKLTMLGMTVVFVFLVVLVLVVHLSSWLLKPYTEREQSFNLLKTIKKSPSGPDSQKLAAVIAAAVAAHRARFLPR